MIFLLTFLSCVQNFSYKGKIVPLLLDDNLYSEELEEGKVIDYISRSLLSPIDLYSDFEIDLKLIKQKVFNFESEEKRYEKKLFEAIKKTLNEAEKLNEVKQIFDEAEKEGREIKIEEKIFFKDYYTYFVNLAVVYSDKEVLAYLIEKGANPESKDSENRNLLSIAIEYDKLEIAKYLLEDEEVGPYLKFCQRKDGLFPIHLAILKKNREIFELLLKGGSYLVNEKQDSLSLLHYSSILGATEFSDKILKSSDKSSIFEAEDAIGRSILHYAAMFRNFSIFKWVENIVALIEKSEIEKNRVKLKELLIKKDINGATCLHYLAFYNKIKGFNLSKNNRGSSLLKLGFSEDKYESWESQSDEIRKIFKYTDQLTSEDETNKLILRDKNGFLPLHYASYFGDLELCNLLISEYLGKSKESSSEASASEDLSKKMQTNKESSKLILSNSKNIGNLGKLTSLDLAYLSGNLELIKMLESTLNGKEKEDFYSNTTSYKCVLKVNKLDIFEHYFKQKKFLEKTSESSSVDKTGDTIIDLAIKFGEKNSCDEIEVAQFINQLLILKNESKLESLINLKHENGKNILHLLIKNSVLLRIAYSIIDNFNDIKDNEEKVPLHYAVEIENLEAIDIIRKFNKDEVNASTELTPLHLAIKKNNKVMIEKLLEFENLDKNIKNDCFNCVLIEKNNIEAAYLLHKKGIDLDYSKSSLDLNIITNLIEIIKENDKSVFYYFAKSIFEEIFEKREYEKFSFTVIVRFLDILTKKEMKSEKDILLNYLKEIKLSSENKKLINEADNYGATPLLTASANGHKEVVELLLEKAASIDLAKKSGATPLFIASQNGHKEIVKLLLVKGSSIDLALKDGRTPLYIASQEGHKEVVELLLTKGASIDLAMNDRRTPLFIASQQGKKEVVELLLFRGASIDLAMNDGRTPLFIASQEGHKEVVELLLSKGTSINLAINDGATPLFIASQNGNKEIVAILIEKGAAINLARNDGVTPLFIASQEGKKEVVELLLSKGASVDLVEKDGATPLFIASQNGNKEVVELLLSKGAYVDLADKDGATPLFIASHQGKKEVVELLLSKGASVDLADKDGATPLFIASHQGRKEIVKLLLSKGASIGLAMNDRRTPLFIASENGHKEVVELLLEKGAAIINQAKHYGRTPLYIASQEGHKEVVELLLSKGAKIDKSDNSGKTPLMTASHEGKKEVVELLLSKGASVDLEDKDGWTSLCIASREGRKEIVELLLSKGASIDLAKNDGWTPLLIASENGHKEVVELLINKGAAINQAKHYGRTPLHIASQEGHKEVVELLLSKGAKIDKPDRSGKTALMTASQDGKKEVVELLLARGSAVDKATRDGRTSIYLASANGHKAIVELLLQKNADINRANNKGVSPLNVADKKGYMEIVKMLIKKGAAINLEGISDTMGVMNEDNVFTLTNERESYISFNVIDVVLERDSEKDIEKIMLIKTIDINHFKELIKKSVSLNAFRCLDKIIKKIKENSKIMLNEIITLDLVFLSCKENKEKILEILVEGREEKLIEKNREGNTVLHIACKDNNENMVRKLLSYEIVRKNINERNELGNTAMHNAHLSSSPSIIAILKEAGADLEIKNKNGARGLDLLKQKYVKINEYDLGLETFYASLCAKINQKNDANYKKLLYLVIKTKELWILDELCVAELINEQDELGNTVISKAIESDEKESVKILLSKGANFLIRNNLEEAAYELIRSKEVLMLVIETALEVGISSTTLLNKENKEGNTLLHILAKRIIVKDNRERKTEESKKMRRDEDKMMLEEPKRARLDENRIEEKDKALLKALINNGADKSKANKEKKTPMDLGEAEVRRFITEYVPDFEEMLEREKRYKEKKEQENIDKI